MTKTLSLALLLTAASCFTARGDTTIVFENFDSYADTAAFEAVWGPDDGNGHTPLTSSRGLIVPNTNLGLVPPNDDPPGIQGNAVNIKDDINQYMGPATSTMATLRPSETQSVRLSGDFFDDALGNKRASIGMRHKGAAVSDAANIIEIGQWNADDTDPVDPNIVEVTTGYAYRVILFGALGGDLVASPNWGFFPLNPVLDRPDDLDELVSIADIGPGWHHYTATVGLTEVTFTLDLFRDGLANTEATEGVGTPGVDSTVTWQIEPFYRAGEIAAFDSLRIGGPSGVTSARESVIDNVHLELIDLVPAGDNADFNGDLVVDGRDFLIWQRGAGIGDGSALAGDGDANGDGNVDDLDYGVWQSQFGGAPSVLASYGVPEPSSLALVGLAGCLAMRRFRRVRR
jgi:hypothetical protein